MCPRALFVLAVAASLGLGGLPGGSILPRAAGQERAAAPGGAAPAPSGTDMALHERAGRECGLDSLFVLLRLTGFDVTFDQTRAAVPIGPMGTTLLELQQAASRLGAKTTLSRCSMAQLMDMPKPVIAYLPKRAGGPVGHFVVVVTADKTGVEVVDGDIAAILRYSPSHFEAEWSGHLLAPAPPQTWARPLTWAAVAGVWLGIGFVCWRARVLRRPRAVPVPAALAQAEGA
jgi:hypothetical protein